MLKGWGETMRMKVVCVGAQASDTIRQHCLFRWVKRI